MHYSKFTGLLFAAVLLTPLLARADAPVTSAPPTTAPPTAASAPAAAMSTPFQYTNGKIVVQAKINGMGPYSLALDSGAETMMITQQVADACKLSVQTGTVEISGTSGSYVPVGQAMVDKLEVGQAVVDKPFCTVSPRAISVDGYIGAPLFNAYTVQIDFGSHQITCYPPDGYRPDPADQLFPITFGKHRVPVVQGSIGGVSAGFEIDTGSTFPAELAPGFVKTNDLTHKFTKIGSVMTNSVAGPANADVYGAPTLSLGNTAALALADNVPTLFQAPAVSDWDGRIGAPVLANYVVTFDYAHSRLYLRPVSAFTPPAATTPAAPASPPAAAPAPTLGSATPAPSSTSSSSGK